MDQFVKVETHTSKLVINNGKGSFRELEIEMLNDENVKVYFEYNPAMRTASIGSIPLSKMQVDILVQFFTQKD